MKHWPQRQPQPEEVPVRATRSITIIQRLARSLFDVGSYELDAFTVTRLITGRHFHDFCCAVPGCPIHSRDVGAMLAIDPQFTVGNCIIPLCKEHAVEAIKDDPSLRYGPLPFALALVQQWFSGRRTPFIEIPEGAFHGLSRSKPAATNVKGISLADSLPADVLAKLGVLPPGAKDP